MGPTEDLCLFPTLVYYINIITYFVMVIDIDRILYIKKCNYFFIVELENAYYCSVPKSYL